MLPETLTAYFNASSVAISLSAVEGDQELLFVNHPFERLTGFERSEAVGSNCRFLQRNADNTEARRQVRAFIEQKDKGSIRTPIVNFRKDGQPFVNLLYIARLRSQDGTPRFLIASQFDISRTKPELLAEYDTKLSEAVDRTSPAFRESGLIVDGSLMTIGNSVAMIAQAKLTLGEIDVPTRS